ncbi:MAG: hypothetical protein WC655_27510 [Candidatus Hydrogenedentales bacterium]|jgi:hypothetical protein
MSIMAIVMALLAAILGSGAWAALAISTDYEVGYVAWGIGVLVGWAGAKFGGRGMGMAVICAVLTLLSIFCGKLVATEHFLGKELETQLGALTEQDYAIAKEEAAQFAALTSEDQYPEYMVKYEYTDATDAASIPAGQLADFKEFNVPNLREFNSNPPTFEQWKESISLQQDAIGSSPIFLASIVVSSLGLIDILFAVLGIGSAYGFIMRAGQEQAAPAAPGPTPPPLQ